MRPYNIAKSLISKGTLFLLKRGMLDNTEIKDVDVIASLNFIEVTLYSALAFILFGQVPQEKSKLHLFLTGK